MKSIILFLVCIFYAVGAGAQKAELIGFEAKKPDRNHKHLLTSLNLINSVTSGQFDALTDRLLHEKQKRSNQLVEKKSGMEHGTSDQIKPNLTHFILMAIFFSILMAAGTGISLFYRLRNTR